MKSTTIQLDEEKIVIQKLPLKKYAELLSALKELPKSVSSLDQLNETQIIQKLPEMIATSYPEVINILVIATGLPQEKVEGFALDELITLCIAVFELNQYKEIWEKIKKVMASQNIVKQLPTPEKTT